MFTVMFVLYEKAGVPRDAALQHWRTTHADIARGLPGVRRYVQSHAVSAPDGSGAPFLGIAELVFDDAGAFEAAAGSPEFGSAMEDLAGFADASQLPTAIVEQVTVV